MRKQLGLILVIAAIMRLSFLGLIEFKADEALTVLSLQQFWQQPHLIQAGLVSSTGARNFPLFQYLLIPAAKVSFDPRFLSAIIGAISVIMIGWFYVATKKSFNSKVALIASIILASAPYPVLFSRKIWAQDFVWLFAIPIYVLILKIRKGNHKPITLFSLGILLSLQTQLHASGLFIALVLISYLLVKKVKLWWPIAGGVVGAIPALPYIWLQFTSSPSFPDLTAYQQAANQLQNKPQLLHLLQPFFYVTNWDWEQIMGAVDYQRFTATTPAQGIGMLAGLLLALGLGYGLYQSIKTKTHRLSSLVISSLVIIYFIAAVPARLHYYQVLAPYIAVVSAWGLIKLFKTQPLFLWPTVDFVIFANLLFTGMFWRYLYTNQGVMGDYGLPYRYSVARVEQVTAAYQTRPDKNTINTYAFFDPVSAKLTNSASIHATLAQYFYTQDDFALASTEAQTAVSLAPHIPYFQQLLDELNNQKQE